ncbi:MAG: hypothetical protein J6X48_11630 [Lachnospiraceae bacterium]|nr:hypothetical protein [Lachnospiraceae bacterium]
MKKTILITVSALIIVFMWLFLALNVGNKTKSEPPKDTTIDEQNTVSQSDVPAEPEPEPARDPEPQPEPEPTEEEILDLRCQEILDTMTLDEKIYQLFFVTPKLLTGEAEVTELTDLMKENLSQKPVGGIVLFKENIISMEQVKNLNSDIANNAKFGILISVDEEGGSVARLGNANIGFPTFQHMAEIGASGDVSKAYEVGASLAQSLKELNFNMDFAPVADVLTNPENKVVKKRTFGSDANLVSDMVAAEVKGFSDNDIICSLKHFPGHGNTEADSHKGMAVSNCDLDTLREREFIPFKAGIEAGAETVMVGHISLPNILDDDTPASLSPQIVTDLLRTELNFQGVIITDSMQMGAVADYYTPEEAAVKALLAGKDMLLMPTDLDRAFNGILTAVQNGEISEDRIDESVRRILMLKLKKSSLK